MLRGHVIHPGQGALVVARPAACVPYSRYHVHVCLLASGCVSYVKARARSCASVRPTWLANYGLDSTTSNLYLSARVAKGGDSNINPSYSYKVRGRAPLPYAW